MSAARPFLGDSRSFYLQSTGLALMAPQASRFLSFAWFSGKSLKWSEQVRHGGVYRSSQLLLGGVGGFLKPRSSKPAWHRHIVGHSSPAPKWLRQLKLRRSQQASVLLCDDTCRCHCSASLLGLEVGMAWLHHLCSGHFIRVSLRTHSFPVPFCVCLEVATQPSVLGRELVLSCLA